jgi:transposase
MTPHLFIGIDRSDLRLDLCVLNARGGILKKLALSTAPEDLLAWVREIQTMLPAGSHAAICIEQPCTGLLHFLSQFDFLVLHLINPVTLKRYREAFNVSRAKDDKKDAFHLARLLFEKHDLLKAWKAEDPESRKLGILTEKRRQLVDLRVSISNRLTQALKDYFPQALKLTGRDIHAPLALAFLEKWPTLQDLQKARPSTITKFYYAQGSRRPGPIKERLELISKAVPLCVDPVILESFAELTRALVKQIRTLEASIRRFDSLIAETLQSHQDSAIFSSLPGAGPTYSARLAAFFGTDRSVYPDASSAQKHSGVAPVTKQSGKMHFVHRRYSCCKFWRQTFVEWAAQTVIKSLWAKAFYQQQKDRGHRHHSILRSLAYKWIRIIHRCWQSGRPYNEALYLDTLKKRNSPLVPIIQNFINQKAKTT